MAAAAIEGTGGGVATAGPGLERRLRGSVGRGDSLDVLYSATTVTTGRSLRKRFVSMLRAASLHACPPHPLAVWSACVLLISNSVFIVYVHSAPQCAKSSSRFGACRAVSYAVCGPHTVGVACYVGVVCRRRTIAKCAWVCENFFVFYLFTLPHTLLHTQHARAER